MANYLTHSEEDFTAYGPWSEFIRQVSDYTMLRFGPLRSLITLCEDTIRRGVPGDFVEAGVWRGGASFVMAEALRRADESQRIVWMFDSFQGLPDPTDVDGERAQNYASNTDHEWYLDNCRADYDAVLRSAADLGFGQRTELVKGWFEKTLPEYRDQIGPIALLRIDCDWFESTKCCLEQLFDQVSPGGVIIIDDYYFYDGSALAVHEFLGSRGYPYRIESVVSDGRGLAYNEGAFIRKVASLDQNRTDRLPIPGRFTVRAP
ncbi:TylF/MycF/NovP-related O-methyltransferase [Nocardia gamkensis]|uniref:TylF/MycF/NovP-related O-methyltransferase n=1 Tax=Nocardia gamkensis TaxID=352869 RepID=UPI0037CC31EA